MVVFILKSGNDFLGRFNVSPRLRSPLAPYILRKLISRGKTVGVHCLEKSALSFLDRKD